jgi:aminomethyltransferase
MNSGQEFDIRPIAPNEARRVEAGIFNYGSDMTIRDTPFHLMGLERLVEEQPQDYIGKTALERIRREGVDRKLVGIRFDSDEPLLGITRSWPASHGGRQIGQVTDAVWSPRLEANIGYVWVPIDLASPGTLIDVESEFGPMTGSTAKIPFVDPSKQRPAQSLRGTVA